MSLKSRFNWKCAVPKGLDALINRAVSVLMESALSFVFAFFALAAIRSWSLGLEFATCLSLGCALALFVKAGRIPFADQSDIESIPEILDDLDDDYDEVCPANPLLESDDQIQGRSTREIHDCKMVLSAWVIGIVAVYAIPAITWLFGWLLTKVLMWPWPL